MEMQLDALSETNALYTSFYRRENGLYYLTAEYLG